MEGDPVIGTNTCDAVKMFMNDPETKGIVLIGEIGGQMENDAAFWIKDTGQNQLLDLLQDKQLSSCRNGHAGAIVGGKDDKAAAKNAYNERVA